MTDSLDVIADHISNWFDHPLFKIGGVQFDALNIMLFLGSIIFVFWFTNKVRNLLVNFVVRKYHFEKGVAEAVGTMVRYVFLVIAFIIIFESAGVNLSSLQVLAGALGVGIGFGLQTIANNFLSGIIILIERPIKVGDRVEVGGLEGNVTDISARATTVLTNDNVSVIVPNSAFIDQQVINWSHNNRVVRFRFPVGVSYKEDPQKVREILLEVANKQEGVLKSPAPDVWFDSFGDSSLNFNLLVWTRQYTDLRPMLKSMLYYEIFKQFAAHGIEIPFPQRDVHIKQVPQIETRDMPAEAPAAEEKES